MYLPRHLKEFQYIYFTTYFKLKATNSHILHSGNNKENYVFGVAKLITN